MVMENQWFPHRLESGAFVRQRHRDRRSLADLALDVQRAVVEIDQRLGDRQPKTSAMLGQIGVGIGPGKRFCQFR